MIEREHTIQQLDPLGAVIARPLIAVAGAGLVLYAIAVTVINGSEIARPGLAALGVGIVVAVAAIAIFASSPLRAPLRRGVHVWVMLLALVALAVDAAATTDSDAFVHWGPIVIGVASMMMAPFRPPREVAAVGVLAAVFAGFVALVQAQALANPTPPIVFVLVATTPILILSLGGATFAGVLVQILLRWTAKVSSAVDAVSDAQFVAVARSVQQERVTILNRDVVPFFAEVLDRADILDEDRERAARIADSIRAVMVAEVDRSWLDLVVDQAAGSRDLRVSPVHDPERLAPAMTTDQRIAVRAVLVALFSHPAFDPDRFDLRIRRDGSTIAANLRSRFRPGDGSARTSLAPYFAVLRVVFADLDVDFTGPTLIVRFTYDEH